MTLLDLGWNRTGGLTSSKRVMLGFWRRLFPRRDCRCEACRSACEHRPGWFAPQEATRAATHLGLSLQAFFREALVIDWYDDLDGRDVAVLAPATAAQQPGTRAHEEDPEKPARCRLLTEGGCRLPFEVRPSECRSYYACDPSTWTKGRPRSLAEAWLKDQTELDSL